MKKIISIALAVVMLFAMGTTAFAAGGVMYLDKMYENGKVNTAVCTVSEYDRILPYDEAWGTEGAESWYIADSTMSLVRRPEVKGDVHLILENGVTVNADCGITLEAGNSLTIHAQSDDPSVAGTLVAISFANRTAIGGRRGGNGKNGANGADDYSSETGEFGEPGEPGGRGSDAGTFCVKGGNVTLTSSLSGIPCIGGGNGGDGGSGGIQGYGKATEPVGIRHQEAGGRGGDGGKSGDVYFYGGSVQLTSDSGAISGGKGGKGGNGSNTGAGGGNGGDGGSVYFYGGNVRINAKYCIKGGNGGEGGKNDGTSEGSGGKGGNGGDGGSVYFYGGSAVFNGSTACLQGGNGGDGGDGLGHQTTTGVPSSYPFHEPPLPSQFGDDGGWGGSGGDGGDGGSMYFYGGSAEFISDAPCFRGGAGGISPGSTSSGGEKNRSNEEDTSNKMNEDGVLVVGPYIVGSYGSGGSDGGDGEPVNISVSPEAYMIAGASKAEAQPVSSYNGENYCYMEYIPSGSTASVISAGYPWTVIAVAVLAAGGIAAAVIITKKKTAKKADE